LRRWRAPAADIDAGRFDPVAVMAAY